MDEQLADHAPLGEGISDRRVTIITSLTVDPGAQDRLVALILQWTDETVRLMPGFLSSTVLRSLDGHRVTTATDWASAEAFESAARPLALAPLSQEIGALARADIHLYEFVGGFLGEASLEA